MTSSYDDIAEWYDDWVGNHPMSEDPYFSAVEALMGDVEGLHLCDLACGQGRVARHLAGRGASVVGIDLSAKMLEIARRHEERAPRGIRYYQSDARTLEGVPDDSFDGVVCHMSLMDISDLAPALRSVARVLRPGGWFLFSILHPCYHTSHSGEMSLPEGTVRTVGRYFVEGHWRSETRQGPPGKVGSYHRTMSTYINALSDAGLSLERAAEPAASEVTSSSPSLAGAGRSVWHEVPAIFVARCRRAGRTATASRAGPTD